MIEIGLHSESLVVSLIIATILRGCSNISNIYVNMLKLFFKHINIKGNSKEHQNWCRDNLSICWFKIENTFYFLRKQDAVLFKLAHNINEDYT